jgi:hypothetical protein
MRNGIVKRGMKHFHTMMRHIMILDVQKILYFQIILFSLDTFAMLFHKHRLKKLILSLLTYVIISNSVHPYHQDTL